MNENRTVESYVAQAVHDALQCQSIKYRSGEYIGERYYRKIMQEIKNCNAKEKTRKVAHMELYSMIHFVAYICAGAHRALTDDEQYLVNKTTNELMDMFTGYTIAAEE